MKTLILSYLISCGIGFSADFSKKDLGYIEDEPFSFYTPELYQKAEQGDLEAQFNLSRCYENGWGVDKDKNESEKWLSKGVKENYPPSLYAYACKLIAVENKNKDVEQAIPLLEEAHKQKYFKATFALSGILADNTCDPTSTTPKKVINVERSNKLLVEAANAGESYAQVMLGNRIIFKNKTEDLEKLTPIQPADGINWYEQAAYKLDANAASELVGFFKYGPNDIEKNPILQKKWERICFDILKRVVALNEGNGGGWETELASYYLDGKGTEKNDAKAFIHMYNAALGGDITAKYEVGYLFEKGIGIPKNRDEAMKWYQRSKSDPASWKNLNREIKEKDKWKESELIGQLLKKDEVPSAEPTIQNEKKTQEKQAIIKRRSQSEAFLARQIEDEKKRELLKPGMNPHQIQSIMGPPIKKSSKYPNREDWIYLDETSGLAHIYIFDKTENEAGLVFRLSGVGNIEFVKKDYGILDSTSGVLSEPKKTAPISPDTQIEQK